MNRYNEYSVEDFVLDAEFQNWVRYKSPSKVAFWEDYLFRYPGQAEDIHKAKTLLQGVYTTYSSQIDEQEIESEISGLISRIYAAREEEDTISLHREDILHERRPFWYWLGAAAVIIAGIFLSWYGFKSGSVSSYAKRIVEKSWVEKYNKTASKQTLHLEDGSVVILEPDSKLSRPLHFLDQKREVYLSGEAYFQVARDINRPFVVYSNKLVTRVLGTSFIVKAQKNAKENVVEVKEGKVSVFRKDDYERITSGTKNESRGIVLSPNQKIVFEEASGMVRSLSAAPEIVPNNKPVIRFDYRNTPVNKVLQDLKEAYQVDIIYDSDLLSDCPLTATLLTQPLLEKLTIICEAIEAKYEVLDGKIIIYGKSCLK